MKLRKSRLCSTITLLASSMLMATSAAAGGLYITEFGTPSQGASGAGAGVLAEDASTTMHNPAGIMELEPGKNHWMVSALYVDPSAKFSNDASSTVVTGVAGEPGNGGDAGVSAVGGGFFWARPMNEKVGAGFAFNSIAAAGLEYGNDSLNPLVTNNFAGRYWATKVDLVTLNLTPSIAWRINDQWTLGFSVPVMVGQLDLDVSVPDPVTGGTPVTDANASISNGDDVSATIGVSVLWDVTERVRLGAAYLGENELNFNSDLSVTGPTGNPITLPVSAVDVTIPFVQTVRLWGSTDIGEHITLLATLAWEDWSSFKNLLISTDGGAGGALPRDWDDTWKVALGMRWRTGGAWSHYAGVAYDSSPTSADKRTADMPIAEQIRLSAGTNFAFQNGVKLGGVLTYADYGKARINNGGTWGNVVGEYTTNRIIFLGANVGF